MLLRQVHDEQLRQLIGDRIRIARGRSKLTQQQVAAAVGGVDKTQISKWEHGHAAPTVLQLLHLGVALGQRPESFLEGLVQPTWELIALGLPDDAKAVVYDLANYLKERQPRPQPTTEVTKLA
jgi:transcriptional regulator with XRE-family HTH domain